MTRDIEQLGMEVDEIKTRLDRVLELLERKPEPDAAATKNSNRAETQDETILHFVLPNQQTRQAIDEWREVAGDNSDYYRVEPVLACFSSADKINLLMALMEKPRTVAELVEKCGFSSTGKVHHLLKQLMAAGLAMRFQGYDGVYRGDFYTLNMWKSPYLVDLLNALTDLVQPKNAYTPATLAQISTAFFIDGDFSDSTDEEMDLKSYFQRHKELYSTDENSQPQ